MFKTVYAIYHAYIWTTEFEYTAQFFRYDTNSFVKEIAYQKCAFYYWNFGGNVHIEELRNGSQVLARIPGLHPTSGHHPPDRQVVKHTGAPIVNFPGATSP